MKPRYKKAKRILNFYAQTFGIKPPYHVLVCGTFCKQALADQINIAEQLPKYLSGEVKLCTSKCAIKECELGGSLLFGPLKVLRQYDIIDCNHTWFKGTPKCFLKIVSEKKTNYIVATQDDELAERLKEKNIPLLHISHNAIGLQTPSEFSKNVAEEKETKKLTLSKTQLLSIAKMKKDMGIKEIDVKFKKKKKKGANPLSCKKKKKKPQDIKDGGIDKEHKKKRRKKKKKSMPITT